MNKFEKMNSELLTEFDRYVLEHPETSKHIPDGSLVALQIAGDAAFNAWSRRVALKQAEDRSKVVFVTIQKLRPARSRIEALEFASTPTQP